MSIRYCLFFAIVLGGCATAELTPAGAKVATSRDPLPPECKNVGDVAGKGGGAAGGAWISNESLIEYAQNDLRNKAAELGATHVRTDSPQMGSGNGNTTTVTITGTAYKCP